MLFHSLKKADVPSEEIEISPHAVGESVTFRQSPYPMILKARVLIKEMCTTYDNALHPNVANADASHWMRARVFRMRPKARPGQTARPCGCSRRLRTRRRLLQ